MRLEAVWDLLQEASEVYRDDREATQELRRQIHRLEEPLRIAIAGRSKAGKSTLVSAIMGEEFSPVDIEAFTWYQDGPAPQAVAYAASGASRELAVTRSATGIHIDVGIGPSEPDPVNDVVVTWPMRSLRHASLVDTPAAEEADATQQILRDADAVLYLTPVAGVTDLKALQSSQQGIVARAAPVNVILVLSRADEIGGGRIDALVAAKQLARQQHHDPRVSALCMGVISLGGLVALASRVLTEHDFFTLATIADAPRMEMEVSLLSTDRFVSPDFPADIGVDARRALLDRFGLHGVRLATTLIRQGSDTRAKLAAELIRRSGLTELRESMNQYFIERRQVLKARSALVSLEGLLRRRSERGTAQLLTQVEQIMVTTHDFRELRLLATLRGLGLGFDPDLATEAHRLIGGNGTNLAARLGIEHEASDRELWELAAYAWQRWQAQVEDPMVSPNQRRAAEVVVRSCEVMLAQIPNMR